MTRLVTAPNLDGLVADELYAELVAAHHGLSAEESAALNARLLLLLINHLGDAEATREALAIARSARRHEPRPSERAGP